MRQRVSGGKLRQIDRASTWRADSRNSQIHAGEALPADLPHTIWLPDEKTAKLWQEVVGRNSFVAARGRRPERRAGLETALAVLG